MAPALAISGRSATYAAGGLDLLQQIEPRLLLRRLGAGGDQAAVELAELLLVRASRSRRPRDEIVVGAELRDRLLRIAQLLPQLDQTVAEPGRGALGRLEARVELVDHIGVGDGVGEARGLAGSAEVKVTLSTSAWPARATPTAPVTFWIVA